MFLAKGPLLNPSIMSLIFRVAEYHPLGEHG